MGSGSCGCCPMSRPSTRSSTTSSLMGWRSRSAMPCGSSSTAPGRGVGRRRRVEDGAGGRLGPLAKVSGRGPARELIELAGWAAWRWAGSTGASCCGPQRRPRSWVVRATGTVAPEQGDRPAIRLDGAVSTAGGDPAGPGCGPVRSLARGAVAGRSRRPGAGPVPIGRPRRGTSGAGCAVTGSATAIVAADVRGRRPRGVDRRASGPARVVVGARAAAWAPAPDLARVVVLDEHDEGYQQEQAPTWHARDVVVERARRAGVPCLLVSPCPSLEALGWGELITEDRAASAAGGRGSRSSTSASSILRSARCSRRRWSDLVRGDRSVLCVLNRTGRVRMLACACVRHAGSLRAVRCGRRPDRGPDGGPAGFGCGRCGTERPRSASRAATTVEEPATGRQSGSRGAGGARR